MTSQRRQSSSYGDDSFEFVDFNNVPRLVASLEEALSVWEFKSHSHDVSSFNDPCYESTKSPIHNKQQRIVVGNDIFELTYHQCPLATVHSKATLQHQHQQTPLSFENYYQFTTTASHPLHRWSGMDRFFILAPVLSNPKLAKQSGASKTNNDQQQLHKLLFSACTTAFNNIHCTDIPVFIPDSHNHARHDAYTGFMLQRVGKHDTLDIRFDSAVLPLLPPPHINNLQALFRRHLNADRSENGLPPLSSTEQIALWKGVVFTYHYKNWYNKSWKQWGDESTGANNNMDDNNDRCCRDLPFGPYNDPLRTITLEAIFPLVTNAPEERYTCDTPDMNTLSTSILELTTEFAPPSQQRASLSTLLDSFLSTCRSSSPNNLHDLCTNTNDLAKGLSGRRQSTGIMRNILHAMGQRGSDIRHQTKASNTSKYDPTDSIVDALFSTSTANGIGNCNNLASNSNYIKLRDGNSDLSIYTPRNLGLRLKYGTTVPWRSLLWNLMVFELDAFQTMDKGGRNAASSSTESSFMDFLTTLWAKIMRRIRWHWVNIIPIPNVDSYLYRPSAFDDCDGATLGIDLSFNILHQKLAMVNCCIHQSIKELPTDDMLSSSSLESTPTPSGDALVSKTSSIAIDKKGERPLHLDDAISDMDDDDFNQQTFDSRSSFFIVSKNDSEQPNSYPYSSSSISVGVSEFTHTMHESFVGVEPSTSAELGQHRLSLPGATADDDRSTGKMDETFEGRSHQHETLLLLKAKVPLWVPLTQCSGFMTEDMIQEQAEIFEKMGTSEDATHQRAKLQSAQLSSDMQSFKAANPHAVLEDFVRWYSPKDWVETSKDGHSYGCLSARMSDPGNIWQTLWKSSDRIPASRQPSLFNLTQEGERALHYLESIQAHEVLSMLLPTVGLIIYDTLASHPAVKYIRPVTLSLIQLADEFIDYPWDSLRNGTCSARGIISKVKYGESMLCKSISLLTKLPKQYDLVESLLTKSRTRVDKEEEQDVVLCLYKNDDGSPGKPTHKEYLLYMNTNPLSINNPLPQRQYSLVKNNEVRLMYMHCGGQGPSS